MIASGYNVTPPSTWDNITNLKRYNGQTQSEYMRTGHTYADFVANVQGVMGRNKTAIEKLSEAPLGGIINATGTIHSDSIQQVAGSISQWELARDILNGSVNGKAIGWDLETVGDITNATYDGYAGITEFALVERQYINGQRQALESGVSKGYSLAIGFSPEQATELRTLVTQFKEHGWDSLADPNQMPGTLSTKQSTLQRLSMIGSRVDDKGRIVKAGYFQRFHEEMVPYLGQRYLTVAPLGPANFDPNLMLNAIDISERAYRAGATPENVLPGAIKYITDAANSDTDILHGANTIFDVTSLSNEASRAGLSFDANGVYSNTVDTIYGTRDIAGSRGQSIGTFGDSLHRGTPTDKNKAGSMESLMEAQQMRRAQTHYGVDDIINELDYLTMQRYEGNRSFVDTVIDANQQITISPQDTKQSVFLMNRGHVANDSADLVLINGEPSMQTYPMSNNTWTLGTHSGYVQLEDGYGKVQDSYVLEFINSNDENVRVYKTFDSIEDTMSYMERNSTMLTSGRIDPRQLEDQYLMSVRDIGRREYDKLFDINSVSVDGTTPDGGYATLRKYLGLMDELEGEKGFKSKVLTPALVDRIRQHEMAKPNAERVLHSEYQIRGFAGMLERLSDERTMLEDIVKTIDGTADVPGLYQSSNNITKTMMASRARQSVIDAISNTGKYTAYDTEAVYALTDVFGVDIKTPNGIRRINTSSVNTAMSNIGGALSGMSNLQIQGMIDDLADRHVIDEDVADNLIHSLRVNSSLDGHYNFNVDLAYQLTQVTEPLRNSDNPIDLFTSIQASEDVSTIALRNKNLQSIAGNLYAGAKSVYVTEGGRRYKTSTLYSQHNLSDTLAHAIQQVEDISIDYYDNAQGFSQVLDNVASKLNLGDKERQMVQDWFTATDSHGNFRGYAIEGYKAQGLQAFVLDPEGASKNAYILLTNQKHSNQLIDMITNGSIDPATQLDTYAHARKTFGEHAAVIELHSLNRHGLTNFASPEVASIMGGPQAVLTTVNQSNNYEKFMTPMLDIYQYQGKVQAEFKQGAEDLYAAGRMSLERAIKKIIDEDAFDAASNIVRRTQNRKLNELAAPSSYRGHYILDEVGNIATVKRIVNYHPSDFLHAYEMNVSGLRTLMDQFAGAESDNVIKQMLDMFNATQGIVNTNKPLKTSQYRTILNSNAFNEFYIKNLFSGVVSGDEAVAGAMRAFGANPNIFNKSIFGLLQSAVADDVTGLFDDSVSQALDAFSKTIPYVNQILPESAVKHNLISFIRPGDFNVSAGLFSTLRPTYTQQNRPLYFELDKTSDIAKLLEADGSYIGQSSISRLEYDIKNGVSGLTTPSGNPFESQHRSISTRFKQINDIQLQSKYAYIEGHLDEVAAEIEKATGEAVDINKLKATFEYMRNDMSTVYEGKWFYDPLLGNQDWFTAPDAKKVSVFKNADNIDADRTLKTLTGLRNQEITSGTVIGVSKSGKSIFYQGPRAIMTDMNIDEIMSHGYTYMLPQQSSINDVKLMIGSEKAMAHTIDTEQLLRYARGVIDGSFADADEALRYSHGLFRYVFDGSMVGGIIKASSHNNNFASYSVWNTIATEYVRAGKGQALIDLLGSDELSPYFADWNIGLGHNGEIVINNGDSLNLTRAPYELEMLLREKGKFVGDAETNARIIERLNYQNERNIITGDVQRVHVNEHLSNSFKLDQRIEQGIRMRTWQPGDDLITADHDYLDTLKAYSTSEDLGKSNQFLNGHLGNLRRVADVYNTQQLAEVRSFNAAVKNNQRNVKGMMESLSYYANPEQFDTSKVLTVNISDLMDRMPESGATVEDLQKFLFYVDGKPSDWLQELAQKQNKYLGNEAYSLYVNLERSITYNGKTLNGVMIPIQNMVTNLQDEQFFTESQRITTSFLDDLVEIVNAPGAEGQKSFNQVINEYTTRLAAQTAIMDKDSDMYKAYGRISLANAGQFQAIDEVPPLTDSMMELAKENGLLEQQRTLQEIISEGIAKPEDLAEYDRITAEINDVLQRSADEIRNAETRAQLPELTALKSSPFRDLSIIDVDGKAYYNNLMAIGEEGFRTLGYDFGQVGMDLATSYFDDNYSHIPQIANKTPFRVTDEEIRIVSDRLEALGVKGITPDNLMVKLDEYVGDHYGMSISKVNKAIVNGRLQEIFGTFEDIGKRYTREVGIFGEHVRYPMFGSQPLMNVVLDDTIQGLGARYFNPVTSLYTNVDFDGDTGFLALIMDGGSIAKTRDRRFREALEVHRRSVVFNNDLLAEIIADGGGLKLDNLNDYRGITAHMLESFREDKYIEAVTSWAKNNDITFKSIKDLTPSQLLSAEYSREMAQAWDEAQLNTLLDKGIIRASLAVPARKENIGSISTPNVKLRATLESLAMDTSIDLEKSMAIREILDDMSNMRTSIRGLTGIVEQKGIDVKHIIDAFGIAQTSKWSLGLTQLFSPYKNRQAEGLANLIKASNHVLFGNMSDADIQKTVQEIMSTSREEFKKVATHSTKDLNTAKFYLRGLFDVAQYDEAIDIFNAAIKTGEWGALQKLMANEEAFKVAGYTWESAFADALKYAKSDVSVLLDKDIVYMRTGDLDGTLRSTAWMYQGTARGGAAKLQQVSLDEDTFLQPIGKAKYIGKQYHTNIEINRQVSAFLHGHQETLQATAYSLRETPGILEGLQALTNRQTSADIFNKLLLNSDGTLRTYSEKAFAKLQGAPLALAGTEVTRWFNLKGSKHIYDSIRESSELYTFAINRERLQNRPTVDALIRQINQDIVNNPDKYAQSTDFHDYSDIFRAKITEQLGGQAVVDRNIVQQRLQAGFTEESVKSFNESLDFLNHELYDIMDEERRLTESFASIQKNLDSLDKEKVGDKIAPLEKILADSESVTKSTKAQLDAANKQTVAKVQSDIYKLFSNTSQMDAKFEWTKPTGYSMVGFGEYMGVQFRQLTKSDIAEIMQQSTEHMASDAFKTMPALQQHAIRQTHQALSQYQPAISNAYVSLGRTYKRSDAVRQVIDSNNNAIMDMYRSLQVPVDNVVKKPMTKKALSPTSLFNSAKETLSKVPMKTAAVAAASLVALGVVNNALHNQRTQSPLTPARKDTDDTPSTVSPMPTQAPMSKQRTVYHDKGSGFNFRVSAKTNQYINDVNNAKLIGMSGGGQASVYSQADMSGVTDNWLENRFAELT